MEKVSYTENKEEIPGSFKVIKKIIKKLIGWYVDPVMTEQQIITNQLSMLADEQVLTKHEATAIKDEVEKVQLSICELDELSSRLQEHLLLVAKYEEQQKRIEDIESREGWTREQFEKYLQRIKDIEGREEWTREQFEKYLQRIKDIEGREEWTRENFSDHLSRIKDIEKREEWVRGKFSEIVRRIEDIEEREEWTRNRFAEHEDKITDLSACKGNEDNFYDKKSYSQSGEDTICAYIINFLGIPMNQVTYLDLGANHAKDMSNSYYFYQKGARGVLVEANPELIPELQEYRRGDLILNKAIAIDEKKEIEFYSLNGDGLSTISYEAAQHACRVNPDIYIKSKYTIETVTINKILKDYFKHTPTILSIDLEGIEEKVIEQIDFEEHRPLIIILENIPYRPYLVIEMKQDKLLDFMKQNDYVEYAFTGINSLYVDRRYVEKFNQKKMIDSK